MAKIVKSKTLSLRLRPEVKDAGHRAAERANRSLSSLIEVLLIEHCQSLHLLPKGDGRAPSPRRSRG